MSLLLWLISGLLLVVLLGFYVSWRATRLDRLHARVETATAALDGALLGRCVAVLELATSGLIDPAAVVLLAVAEKHARQLSSSVSLSPERAVAEVDLTLALSAFLAQPDLRGQVERLGGADAERGRQLLDDLEYANSRVAVAEQFYSATVELTLRSRNRPLVRLLHLWGRAPAPDYFTDEVLAVPS
jgi:hypothetical protein